MFAKKSRIQFGYLHTAAIGHQALEADIAIIQLPKRGSKVIWITTKEIANHELMKLIGTKLVIVKNRMLRSILLPIVKWSRGTKYDGNPLVNDKTTFIQDDARISFPLHQKEEERVVELLNKMKIQTLRGFVCLVVRDELHSSENVSKQSAFSSSYRNSSISDYEGAVSFLVSQGFGVIRMGRLASPANFDIQNFFDYANSSLRSDSNDLLIMAKCEFVISTLSGIDEIATMYRRPVYIINYLPVGSFRLTNLRPLVLPKGLIDSRTSEKLSLNEIVARGLWEANDAAQYTAAKVKIIDCQPEVITSFAKQAVDHYLKREHLDQNNFSNPIRDFFISAKNVPSELVHKVPEVSRLWLNY